MTSDKSDLKGKTITFVGFSLGAQVIKSTLNRLFKLGRFDLVHNTYFMGSSLKIGKPEIQFERFSKVMSGKLVNIYHKGDSVVKLNNFIRKISAIGVKPIFENKEERKADPAFKVENFNV